jgi:diguanylate cyclase (GGDEF)-like protein
VVVITAAVVALAAGFAIAGLNGSVNDRRRSETILADFAAETHRQSALEWQAVAQGHADASLLAEARESHAQMLSELRRLGRLNRGDAQITKMSSVGARYAQATELELKLFVQGRREEAERVDSERVDPTFDELHGLIGRAREQAGRNATRTARTAELGTLGALILAALMMGGIFWRFDRARRRAQEAFYDPLTGLANRAFFADRVTHALAAAKRREEPVGVLLLDLDDFKTINDSLGHSAGDQLLIHVAERIASCARESDTTARLGGDEFALLFDGGIDIEGAKRFSDRLAAVLAEPFVLDGREVHVTATAGCAFSLTGKENPDELLRNADLAMYSGKRSGKACVVAYEASMHIALIDRLELETDLRYALERGQLSVNYQPILDIESGSLTSVEALARWDHPDRGFVPPALFIPIAEETGMIRALGRWVLDEACRRTRCWQIEHPLESGLSVSVNVSASQFGHGELVDHVAEALRLSGLAPDRLVLEITETTLAKRGDEFLAELEELAGLGVRLAVDDFGVGYSSLSSLSRFPIDIIKIDKLFVDDVADADAGLALVRSIVDLSSTLGLVPVAEGIESSEQLAALREIGCASGQGYLLAKPMKPEALSTLLGELRGDKLSRNEIQRRPRVAPPELIGPTVSG